MIKQFRIASLADHPHAAPVLAHWASGNDLASQRIAVIVQRAQQHGLTQHYLQTECSRAACRQAGLETDVSHRNARRGRAGGGTAAALDLLAAFQSVT